MWSEYEIYSNIVFVRNGVSVDFFETILGLEWCSEPHELMLLCHLDVERWKRFSRSCEMFDVCE